MAEECGAMRSMTENSLFARSYAHLKERIIASIESAAALEHASESPLAELREKLKSNTFNLVVVGQFKRGKTCLINALLGQDILPVAVVPLTSIVTVLTYGDTLKIRVFFNDGSVSDVEFDRLADYVTETGNPKNFRDVKEVVIDYPSPYLKDGVRLIDTPGVGSVYQHNTDVAYRYLPKSDAALFLLSVEQPVSKAEMEFLEDVRQYSHKIFFLLNKIDYLTEDEIESSIAFTRQTIEGIMGCEAKVFPVSAKRALTGQLEGSGEIFANSGLPLFSDALNCFLLNEKGKIFLLSVTGSLERFVSQARLEAELEQKSLTTPLEELKEKIEAFQTKKEEILREREDFDIFFNREVDGLIKSSLEKDIHDLKSWLAPQMEERLDAFYQEQKDLSLKELSALLEEYVEKEVQQAFSSWREREEEKISSAFEGVCERHFQKAQEFVNELLSFSSQLFSIPFEPAGTEMIWMAESGFQFKLKTDAVGLEMLASSLAEVVPGLVSSRFSKIKEYLIQKANKLIYSKRKAHMLQLIEMHAGRIRYDFVDRINKSRRSFRARMHRKIDATVGGIEAAIEKGMNWRVEGQKEVESRREDLVRTLRGLEDLRLELLSIREAIDKE